MREDDRRKGIIWGNEILASDIDNISDYTTKEELETKIRNFYKNGA